MERSSRKVWNDCLTQKSDKNCLVRRYGGKVWVHCLTQRNNCQAVQFGRKSWKHCLTQNPEKNHLAGPAIRFFQPLCSTMLPDCLAILPRQTIFQTFAWDNALRLSRQTVSPDNFCQASVSDNRFRFPARPFHRSKFSDFYVRRNQRCPEVWKKSTGGWANILFCMLSFTMLSLG